MSSRNNPTARESRAQNRALRVLGTQEDQSEGDDLNGDEEDNQNPEETSQGSGEEDNNGEGADNEDEEIDDDDDGENHGNDGNDDENGQQDDENSDAETQNRNRSNSGRRNNSRGRGGGSRGRRRHVNFDLSRNREHQQGIVITQDILRELLAGQAALQRQVAPVINVQPSQSLELKTPYGGGLDLDIYKRDFYTIMRHNKWNQEIAMMKLRGNLTGTASKVVENRCREVSDVTVGELFDLLEARCNNDEARINAKAVYDSIRQRKDEKIADFVERFEKARMQAQMPDGPSAAMKFFRDLTCNVESIPFNTKLFVNVQAVAEALAGLDLTATIRKRKPAAKEVESEDDADVKFSSKLAEEIHNKFKRRHTTRAEDDEEDALMEDSKSATKEVKALVQSLAVLSERILPQLESQGSKPGSYKGSSTWSGRRQDLPKAVPDARNNRDDPDCSVKCQLCKVIGHEALHCRNLRCMQCQRFGHSEIDCTFAEACQKCGRMGHAARWCESGIQCRNCGKLGHSEKRCRAPSTMDRRRVPSADRRPQQRPTRDGSACFKCGEQGHFARECQRDARGTGSNALPVSRPRDDHQRHDEFRDNPRHRDRSETNARDGDRPRPKGPKQEPKN